MNNMTAPKPKKKRIAANRPPVMSGSKQKKPAKGGVGRVIYPILVGLAAVMVGFFIYVKVQGEISIAENAVGTILTPIQGTVSSATKWVRGWVQNLIDVDGLRDDYERLQVEKMHLEYQLSQMEEEAQENDRLKALLDARDKYETLDPIYAKVIAKDPGTWFDIFSINRGQLQGVAKGMAVISGGGLVGRVTEVGADYAKVMCIINGDSSVACLIERTRENGVMKGRLSAAADDDTCRMYYVKAVGDIVPGDSVITSGLDEIYPKGLVVGTVTEVSRQSDTSNQYLSIKPAADFLHLEEVLVLQTIIETDDSGALPSVPEATTMARPTEKPDESAEPVGDATAQPSVKPNNWALPTSTPDPDATREPVQLNEFPEDIWANS